MKKIPYGIFDYRKLQEESYIYVDKTMYLEKLENIASTIICLRPGRFGKSLMTSMMYYYYDVNSSSLFDTLFKNTYVYNNPTHNKNNYYILKFDFSGITTVGMTTEELKEDFINKVVLGIKEFYNHYGYKEEIDESKNPNIILGNFLSYFNSLKLEHKLYIIIDEYDNFTNGILEGDTTLFESIVSENGFIKSFYAVIKEYIGLGVVDRFYATGICPVTLNSMTTGFNIATDISTYENFNSMIGLTHDEVIALLKELDLSEEEKKELYKLMIENYDGYLFNEDINIRIFSATLVMYLLNYYQEYKKLPKSIIDKNITVNYGKIDNLVKIKNNEYYREIIDEIIRTGEITGRLKNEINVKIIDRDDIISLLYYFGYLTIKTGEDIYINFRIPNEGIKETYNNYFIKILEEIDVDIDDKVRREGIKEVAEEGKIEKISLYVSEILKSTDNRIFIKFDEKYIQLIYYTLLRSTLKFKTYVEFRSLNGYIDIMIIGNKEYTNNNIMIELKYIKKSEYTESILESKIREGKEQLKKYELDERIEKENLKKYLVVYVGSELKLMENV